MEKTQEELDAEVLAEQEQANKDAEETARKLALSEKDVTCPYCMTVFNIGSRDIKQKGKVIVEEVPDNIEKDYSIFCNYFTGEK
jgi:hypothetical protein